MSATNDLLSDSIANYPASTVACFDPTTGDLPRRRLDHQKTIRFLESLSAAGADAVLIAASTGHGHLRTVDELSEWFAVAAEANLPTTMKMALLRPEDSEADNRRLIGELKDLAYDVVFVRPGVGLSADANDDDVVANMLPLISWAAEAGLPLGVYSISDVSGAPLTANATAALLNAPGGENIVAAKITEADYEASTLSFLADERLARLKIVQGWDPHFARALADGPAYDAEQRQRVGVTSGPMSFAVFQYVHMFAVAAAGDTEELQSAQSAVTELFSAMQDDPRRFADLQRAKVIMGLGQPLLAEASPALCKKVISALANLPRDADRQRLARSLDLLGDGPFHDELAVMYDG